MSGGDKGEVLGYPFPVLGPATSLTVGGSTFRGVETATLNTKYIYIYITKKYSFDQGNHGESGNPKSPTVATFGGVVAAATIP